MQITGQVEGFNTHVSFGNSPTKRYSFSVYPEITGELCFRTQAVTMKEARHRPERIFAEAGGPRRR